MLNRLVAEDHRPALERQAEEHHRSEAVQNHSEGLFELLALKRMQQESLGLTPCTPGRARLVECFELSADTFEAHAHRHCLTLTPETRYPGYHPADRD